ncbi:N-acetylmuramate alpha-1-phosphate uridylyltransferase MurU [Saccharophagus sp. K07]|uniref:N-acetylmuramate alpha-1-phosphate uridylyltransferase MurU n=1 Tax=Saccharophagus sp. K07 TaxID=2283636 RepID=UPI001651ED7B|nr:nucleotidyltransferase family protein [Saccharophagus sp. K07]
MKAMILAAGEGRRMRPLTLATPKPLLQVKGISLIEHHIRRLKAAGISEFVINIAYLGEQIRTALGDGSQWNVRIDYSAEPEPLETAGAILHALPLLGDQPFLLVNGDVWTDYPFARLIQAPIRKRGHLVLVENPAHKLTGDFSLDANNAIQELDGETSFTFSGISVLTPSLIAEYPQKRAQFPLREIFSWAIQNRQLTGEFYEGVWCDVGTPERLQELNR